MTFNIVRIETNPQSDVLPECAEGEVPTRIMIHNSVDGSVVPVFVCMRLNNVDEPARTLGTLTGMGFTPNDWE